MKAIIIVFGEDVKLGSMYPYIKTNEEDFMDILEESLRLHSGTNQPIEITTLSESDIVKGITITNTGDVVKIPFSPKKKQEEIPLYVKLTIFLNHIKDEFGNADSSFTVLEMIKHKGRPDIADGLILCTTFARIMRIHTNERKFRMYMSHLNKDECTALINFIILLSKI